MTPRWPGRRWRIDRRGRGLFEITVDDGDGFRPATTAEVDTALRQRNCGSSIPRRSRSRSPCDVVDELVVARGR